MNSPILVTGATGNVGRQVVSQLVRAGHRVRALSRNPASAHFPREVEVVQADLGAPESLDEALNGVEAVFLLWRSQGIQAVPATLDRFQQDAKRIVFLSSSAVRDDTDQQSNPIGWLHAEIEHAIERSGLAWTFLRPGGFASNALWWWAPQIQSSDILRWPFARASTAPIHEADMAAVAVRALTEDGHAGAKYILTGPESLTQTEQLSAIGQAVGRRLRFEEIPPVQARQEMTAILPSFVVEILLDVWSKTLDHPAPVTTTVSDVTGLPARTFHEWALDHAASFRLVATEANRTSTAGVV